MRLLAALLLLANLLFFAWSQGWLDTVTGMRVHAQGEPERLARQVHPEILTVLTSPAAGAAKASATPLALACLQAGPFSPAEAAAAETTLQGAVSNLAEQGYANVATDQPGRWALYIGKLAGADALQRRQSELKRRNQAYEVLPDDSELAPGLLLSQHDSADAAEEALRQLSRRGIRGAKLAQLAAPSTTHRLRVERADAALQTKLYALAEPAFAAHPFERCDNADSAGTEASAPASAASAR